MKEYRPLRIANSDNTRLVIYTLVQGITALYVNVTLVSYLQHSPKQELTIELISPECFAKIVSAHLNS